MPASSTAPAIGADLVPAIGADLVTSRRA